MKSKLPFHVGVGGVGLEYLFFGFGATTFVSRTKQLPKMLQQNRHGCILHHGCSSDSNGGTWLPSQLGPPNHGLTNLGITSSP